MKKPHKKGLYQTNKAAKVGEIIECPVCHTRLKKIQYSQAFCCGQCKDKFHNQHNKDRHRYIGNHEDDMTDRDWDEAFSVVEYSVED